MDGTVPTQSGRVALVTGSTGGIGYHAAAALAGAGASVILAGRNAERASAALGRIRARHENASVRFERVDQADLADVGRFARVLRDDLPRLDILINNAGLFAPPQRQTTADGFELQFGVNYLSHFALTADLLPLLRAAAAPRVVCVASIAHRFARIALGDLQGARRYNAMEAYAQSKLAMLMFAFELQRRSDGGGWGLTSVAAHPGWARTGLFYAAPRLGKRNRIQELGIALTQPFFSQSAEAGAAPLVAAATDPSLRGGEYLGPQGGIMETRGPVGKAHVAAAAEDEQTARDLWAKSEEITGRAFQPDRS